MQIGGERTAAPLEAVRAALGRGAGLLGEQLPQSLGSRGVGVQKAAVGGPARSRKRTCRPSGLCSAAPLCSTSAASWDKMKGPSDNILCRLACSWQAASPRVITRGFRPGPGLMERGRAASVSVASRDRAACPAEAKPLLLLPVFY